MNRSLSRVRVSKGRAYVADMYGVLHCLDANTGKHLWHHNFLSTIWNSPLVTDQAIYVGTEDGDVVVLSANETPVKPLPQVLDTIAMPQFNSVYSNPVGHNGVLYVVTRNQLIAIEKDPDK